MDKRVNLREPEMIVVSEDIKNPDFYIDFFMSKCARDDESIARFEAIKALDHESLVSH